MACCATPSPPTLRSARATVPLRSLPPAVGGYILGGKEPPACCERVCVWPVTSGQWPTAAVRCVCLICFLWCVFVVGQVLPVVLCVLRNECEAERDAGPLLQPPPSCQPGQGCGATHVPAPRRPAHSGACGGATPMMFHPAAVFVTSAAVFATVIAGAGGAGAGGAGAGGAGAGDDRNALPYAPRCPRS